MRNIFRLLILCLCLYACSSDEASDGQTAEENIVGLWKGSDVVFTIQTDFLQNGNSFSRTCTSNYIDSDYFIEFMTDPMTFDSNGDFFVETICDDLDPYFEEFSLFGDGQWSFVDSELQFTAAQEEPQGITVAITYQEIDSDTIILGSERVQNFEDGPNSAQAVFTVEVELIRQN
jgi:hypothetical protein